MLMPGDEFMSTLGTSLDVLEKLGILETVRNKLVNNPKPAARHLSAALAEIGKTYAAIDDLLVNISSLAFETEEGRKEAEKFLRELQGGRFRVEVEKAKGHCSKIGRIYDNYLSGWFSEVLDQREAEEIRWVFSDLAISDQWILRLMEAATDVLPKLADRLLELMAQKDITGAAQLSRDVADRWKKPRRRLAQGMAELWRLQDTFSELTGTI